MNRHLTIVAWVLYSTAVSSISIAQQFPDIRSIEADLIVPELSAGEPRPGLRVKATLPAWNHTDVYHVLHLPENWNPDGKPLPVLVEWAGNGDYENKLGDTCNGRPEGCKLGYGLSAGQDFIWLCLPYLNSAGDKLATKWWGEPPNYDPEPTLKYCRTAVDAICDDFHGDPSRVVLCGFSRGGLACNYLGLHDERTSKLWCGFLAYSHYDGVRNWPYPDCDRESAAVRLQRLGTRPQFICAEGDGVEATREYLNSLELANVVHLDRLTFASTGFRNHNDAWILRPSVARQAARHWLIATVSLEPTFPAELLDLSAWKLTLPLDTPRAGKPDEVTQPELANFVDPSCFCLSVDKDAVLFRAACGSPTTKGSGYPRSELRQMEANGIDEVAWTTDGERLHVIQVEQAITALPQKKPHVVCAQIHDADSDLIMIRLEKKKLFVEREKEPDVVLESNYELGQRFKLRIAGGAGKVRVWYNEQLKLDWPVSRDGCYFKVGCYTQSNVSKGDAPEAYGEVAVYDLRMIR